MNDSTRFCLVFFIEGGMQDTEIAFSQHCSDCIFFEVQTLNKSTILVQGHANQSLNLSFGNAYSNAKPYIELLEPRQDFFLREILRRKISLIWSIFRFIGIPHCPMAFLGKTALSNQAFSSHNLIFQRQGWNLMIRYLSRALELDESSILKKISRMLHTSSLASMTIDAQEHMVPYRFDHRLQRFYSEWFLLHWNPLHHRLLR